MIKLYNAETIAQLEWPETKEGLFAKNYLLPLFKEQTRNFIKNAKTTLYVVKINDKIIPLTKNEKEYENSYLLSPYFFITHLKEKYPLCTPILHILGLFLKLFKINKVIIINNWLMSTNPYPELSQEEVQAILTLLTTHFPHHYFMFRSLTTYQSDKTYNVLKHHKFRIFLSRFYFLYDPQNISHVTSSMLRKQKKDFNKISRQNYQIEDLSTLSEAESKRILDLYNQVYLTKYTRYSPQYTPRFLTELIKNQTMNLKVLKKEGEIYGAAGFVKKDNYLLTGFFGYDTTLPQEEGLYRMLSGVIMEEIKKGTLLAHQGSGAPDFKLWRGFTEEPEYIAIFDRHLSISRRLFWSLTSSFYRPAKRHS